MAPAGLLEHEATDEEFLLQHEATDDELFLLIREARRRQRRRLVRRALVLLVTSVIAAVAALAATGAYSPAADLTAGGRPASAGVGACPTSPARFVANSVYSATVLGRGTVRLATGNVYLKARRRIVLGTTGTTGWSAIEAIWVVDSSYQRPLALSGKRVGKPGAIDLQSADAGLAPGGHGLVLAPESPNATGDRQRLYAGAIWVRSAGCYAVTVSGRGIHERIVFAAQPH